MFIISDKEGVCLISVALGTLISIFIVFFQGIPYNIKWNYRDKPYFFSAHIPGTEGFDTKLIRWEKEAVFWRVSIELPAGKEV